MKINKRIYFIMCWLC